MDRLAWAAAFFFWVPFLVRGRIDAWKKQEQNGPPVHRDANAELYVWLHAAALGMQYASMAMALYARAVWPLFPGQAWAGAAVVLAATALASWVMVVFRTWRIKAELAQGHELCTAGPFRWLRHPIYTAMALQAIGTTIWLPNPVAICGVIAMVVAGDLRARAEEQMMLRAFGPPYAEHLAHTWRFVPFLY